MLEIVIYLFVGKCLILRFFLIFDVLVWIRWGEWYRIMEGNGKMEIIK